MRRYILTFILTLMTLLTSAQITIGGDVYGGGKEGAVGTGNTSATKETATTEVTLSKPDSSATSVIISQEAVVRTVFGGGMNGRVYGQTNVTVEGGTVGAQKWNGTIHGGIFGAGDGEQAYVFGKINTVTIKGGTIYNNIYGGGNQADLMGSTAVILQYGDMFGSVFGGARMANVFGHSYVNLDGANVPDTKTLIVPAVYGGNDISGTIATSTAWLWTNPEKPFKPSFKTTFPSVEEFVDNTWNAFVLSTCKNADTNNIFVGALYGGGNGDYEYNGNSLTLIDTPAEGETAATTQTFTDLNKPELGKTYLNIEAGTFGQMYGGGNNATVTGSTDIMVWNQNLKADGTAVIASIPYSRISEMGLHESFYDITGDAPANAGDPDTRTAKLRYQTERLFGGNNKAAMDIRPNWYLVHGTFNNIYSGGNQGEMTNAKGIVVNIGSRSIYVNNVYGGSRLADVHPKNADGSDVSIIDQETISVMQVSYNESGATGLTKHDVKFEENLSARVYVSAGHINNVYGGNDISGRVYKGTNVKIAGAISGNVFGGGNGSYAYTDNADLKDHAIYGDYYYDPSTASSSIDALNLKRPHVDNTMLHIYGEDGQEPQIAADGTITAKTAGYEPVIVTGGVYCGGNSATLDNLNGGDIPKATFKIGKNVIINAVYMGSNGAEMVTSEMMGHYKNGYSDITGISGSYSTVQFTQKETFAKYMDGCAVDIRPSITYDWATGDDPHTYIGSLYGGGNVGSVTYNKAITLNIPAGLKVYDRVVGGCRAADIDERDGLNAAYEGGFTAVNTGDDATKPKLTINMDAYLEPRELVMTLQDGKFLSSAKLIWDKRIYFKAASEAAVDTDDGVTDRFTTLYGANVFGGCYSSGHIAGDVTINVTRDIISPAVLSMVKNDAATVLNGLTAQEEFEKMGNYVFAKAMTIYGGGYGEPTTIRGDLRVNLSQNARVLNVLGGADYGMIGTTAKAGWHDAKTGNVYVTAAQGLKDYTDAADGLPYNCMQIYGGAFFGAIYGHTELHLNGGTFLNAFGGSCDADIADYTSIYLGNSQTIGSGYPYIKGYVFGGNDFGGVIGREGSASTSARVAGTDFGSLLLGYHDFSGEQAGYDGTTIRTTRYLEYNSGRIGLDPQGTSSLYGGSYGSYDYSKWFKKTNPNDNVTSVDYPPTGRTDKKPLANEYIPVADDVFVTNTYVNVKSSSTNKEKDYIARGIFGGGRGIMDILGIVDAKQTYVYLHGANWASRGANLSNDIYGGGYFSVVENTKVDLERGCTGVVYGGSYGTSAANLNTDTRKTINYNSARTEVNLYSGMDNADMSIFGGGGYAGATNTYVNLYGGKAKNVYGGSYNEGFCQTTNVAVPATSTAIVNAIFGGGYGSNVALPCDEETTNVTFASANAYVADAIYGGNNDKRAARRTNITINQPVKNATTGLLSDVYGGGNGASTVCGETNVTLNSGAQVKNLYGGGRDGKVYGYYVNTTGASTYYTQQSDKHAQWYFVTNPTKANTNLTINKGATAQNVFGGGCGADATVCGTTYALLNGGSVLGDGFTTGRLFGGGESGNVRHQKAKETAQENGSGDALVGDDSSVTPANQEIYTYSYVKGGDATVVYGGGFKGYVGDLNNPAETRVDVGIADQTNHDAGSPIIERSLYGGGYSGAVYGTAKVQMLNGYVGYDYNPTATDDPNTAWDEHYTEKLKASDDDGTNKLKESGNLFGGGYGEGATTDHSIVNMYGGTIRNSLYGGGEIASIGRALLSSIDMNDRSKIPNIQVAGSTDVNMYGGLVSANVFGGGRGYAIDAYGNTLTGEMSYSDGFVFGKTNVYIHRGTIGTAHTLANGDGNVFGGGNIGFVYGAEGTTKNTSGAYSGYYNVTKNSTDGYYYQAKDGKLSEDCKVVIAPVCRVKEAFDTYQVGDYVPYDVLNKTTADNEIWNKVDKEGVKILNAVFAGGNVSRGSDKIYANTKTIYGNATASVTDIFCKDLITIGGEGVGGLYGDGSLTFVDGYREVNVSNYGTDYYNLNQELTVADYYKLTDRERAYFELLYKNSGAHKYEYYEAKEPCSYTYEGHVVDCSRGQKITEDVYNALTSEEKAKFKQGSKNYSATDKINDSEYNLMDATEKKKWTQAGFCTLYAGRMLNTIQRADFCGVFGSRIVLKGAQDRVPSVVDYTNYTLNRIHELSLNQRTQNSISHGNYFGIYSVVNYLGALTSDVDFFEANRTTDNDNDTYKDDPTTEDDNSYAGWKKVWLNARKRNNGSSPNEVALSSGVWLEIVDESTDNNRDGQGNIISKNYGPITGVIQLDLVNVATGEGGGYVYAKNEHGVRTKNTSNTQITLASANTGAISQKMYTYEAPEKDTDKMQSSGNFVNSVKRIIDDCFPRSSSYAGTGASPAHYWFVRGDFYVYDQYISAFTGTSQAYSEKVSIPLTITAESHGRLKLESVNQNHYAYWTDAQYNEAADAMKPNGNDGTLLINGLTYTKNQPISYYDYNHLTDADKSYFKQMTYICTVPCKLGDKTYNEGDVISPSDYNSIISQYGSNYICTYSFSIDDHSYIETQMITQEAYNNLSGYTGNFQPLTYCFHPSNEISHDKGYILTFDWDNPDVWNQYYHAKTGTGVLRQSSSESKTDYILAPTYKANAQSSIYGQTSYGVGDVVDLATYNYQATMKTDAASAGVTVPEGQASFDQAYVAKEDCKFTITSGETSHTYTYVKGAPISKTLYDTFGTNQSHFELGYLVTETYEASSTKQYLFGEIIPQTEYNAFTDAIKAKHFSSAYICTAAGKWGGQVFVQNNNYEAAKFGNLLPSERGSFVYNYDALDLLSENFSADGVTAKHYQGASGNHANAGTTITNQIGFCEEQLLDYSAVYSGSTDLTLTSGITLKRDGTERTNETTIKRNDELSNTVFESLTNYQANYSAIEVTGGAVEDNYYVVKAGFQLGDSWYSPGKVVRADVYDNLANKDDYITVITKEALNDIETLPGGSVKMSYYFCKQEFNDGTNHTVGSLISATDFGNLTNLQKNFDVIGPVPSETATLYVARGTDIKDLLADKIVTPIYWYEYEEADDNGNYETVRERHIINIHIHFESGVPTVGELLPPSTVLPGTSVGLNQPSVAKGAYEILGGGWEMFTNESDALSHRNGIPYTNNNTKMYWYEDGYFVSYYAKSYLGKTYSNPVKFSVANYHDIEEVLTSQHTEDDYNADGTVKKDAAGNVITKQVNDYMYIAEAVAAGKRNPKIYIGDTKNAGGKSELDRLSELYGLTSADAVPSNLADVANCANLDFMLKEDIHQTDWTSVGAENKCFVGNVHGNGHSISGLRNSLFNYFSGNVYNLGVAGSFTGAGIADHTTGCDAAHAYNCWVATSGDLTSNTTIKAVFGDAGSDQLFNCYYPETNNYVAGTAISKPLKSFLDGEVAYNLNSFYLTARQHRLQNIAASGLHVYNYYELKSGDLLVYDETTKTNRLNADTRSMSYDNSELVYSIGDTKMAYVEDYIYATPDFLYADGTIPASNNIRRNAQGEYHAIFPDDYIFFGQNLSYGIVQNGGDYVDHPQAVRRQTSSTDESKNTKLLATDITESNRIYRAPAYYKSSTMSTAHFNQYAAFAGTMTLAADNVYGVTGEQKVYKDLTAIDFTGNGDTEISGGTDQTAFYKKFLDYNGLAGYTTSGLTRNLLVYADPTGDVTSYGILNTALPEATLSYNVKGYNDVAIASDADKVRGHLVDKTAAGTFIATRDHYLYDKENFNCPIKYTFGKDASDYDCYMWYQRSPDNYVDLNKGWEAISLPFTADLVSTQTKGEITHFYHKSGSSTYDKGYDSDHEYWLREFKGKAKEPADNTFYAAFDYPKSVSGHDKQDTNDFLWDYYYSHDDNTADGIDKDNYEDEYQQNYYRYTRTYNEYPLYEAAVPYLIGFPGSRYYEFDLSGEFEPQYRLNNIAKLDAQTISFISVANAEINVSDDELTPVTDAGYKYVPNYMNSDVAVGSFVLNSEGSSFDKTTAVKSAVPFRPYFKVASAGGANMRSANGISSIVISGVELAKSDKQPDITDGQINIYCKGHNIYIENGTKRDMTFRIISPAGTLFNTITVSAQSKGVVQVMTDGVYLVGNKKLLVR